MIDELEREVDRIERRFISNPRPSLERALAIMAEEFAEVMQDGLAVNRGQHPDTRALKFNALRTELIQLSAYAYHLAMRVGKEIV